MATHELPAERLEPALESVLARLRRRIRAYVWADGIAGIVIVLGVAFWLSLALDWLIEPPKPLRIAVLVATIGALVFVAWRLLVSRLLVRLENRNMALVIERRFRDFHDSLLTAVELSEHPDHAVDFNPQMLARAKREAMTRAERTDLSQVFNVFPLARRVTLAVALGLSVAVFAVAASSALGVWARRALAMSNELWPRSTHLSVEGFEPGGRVKIARGSDWNLLVKANAALGNTIPEIVEVRYSTTEGAAGRENMSREGVVAPGEAPFQPYAYTFKSVLAPLEFYVAGGDDREGPFYLDVVDSPDISRMTLRCQFPAYTRRANRELPAAGIVQLPRGTQVTIVAASNKPLVSVQIDDLVDENTPVTTQLDLAAERGSPQSQFEYSLAPLEADKTLIFTLFDTDGIRSRDAIRLSLSAVADEPPQVNVALKGIGTAITPEARLPAAGEVADDYGVEKIWFDYHVDEAAAQQKPLAAEVRGQDKLAVTDVLEIGDLELKPKQKLHFAVQAADGCTLASGANVGTSQRYVLDVVTADELRSMLEARELVLRRRFEAIISEMTDTRDLLAGVDLKAAPPADAKAENAAEAAGAAPHKLSSAVQVERVLQNSQRASHETMQLAIAFDDIREEMVNNRIDTKELKDRLQQGVADPLKRIVNERFSKLDEQLKQLTAQLADPAAAVPMQAAAVAQIDGILVEMKQVLDKMLELETFNEVLDTLRQIIEAQENLNQDTKQKQKSKLKDLID